MVSRSRKGSAKSDRIAGLAEDITERKEAEEALREYQKVVEGSQDMIAVVDRRYRYRLANETYLKYRDTRKEDFIGRSCEEILGRDVFERTVKEYLDRCFLGETIQYEMKATYPKLGERDLLVSYLPIRGPGGIDRVAAIIRDISQDKKFEETLRLAIDATDLGIWDYCPQTGKLECSDNAKRHFGFPPGARVDFGVFTSGIHPDDRERVIAYTNKTLLTHSKEEHCLEYRTRGIRDGKERWVNAWTHAFFNEKGEPIRFIGATLDITERKQAEEKLRRAKEEWERTFDSVPDMVTIIDDQYRVLRVNEATARRLGRKAEECVGLRCYEAVHGLSEPPDFCPHSRTLEDGRQHIEEVHEDRLGGRFLVSTTPLHDEQGRMIGTVHVAHDITERKKVEDALRESERQMTMAQEVAHLGSWELDLLSNRLSWSDEVYRIFGLMPQEFGATYDAFLEAVHPEDRAAVDAAYSGSLREGKDTYEIEHRVVRKSSGEVRIVHEKCEHIRDEAGRIIKSVGMVHDVTERKKAEEGLKRAYDELEIRVQERTTELEQAYESLKKETREREQIEDQLRQAQKMEAVGTLAGGIAHDFNNMLAVIIGNAEIALDDIGQDGPHRNLNQILEASMRSRTLVKQILTFSRKSARERKPLSLTPLVKETARLLRASLPSTIKIELDVRTDSDIILADPSQVQQVLMNLSTNAAHAMNEDGGTLTVGLSDAIFREEEPTPDHNMQPGRYIVLTVRDTGKGMSKQVRDRIFEPFFTTKELGQGTGMGLAVVFGIVNSLEGAITVESKMGEGSAFKIFFPAYAGAVEEEPHQESLLPKGNEKVLLVDDEPSVVAMASETLKRLGYRVTTADGGPEGWRTFEADPHGFDLVITDHVMPDITGMRLAEKMLAVRKDLPIILFTGYSETVSPEKARAAGISGFLMKPVVKRELAETVRQVLDSRNRDSVN